MQPLFAHNLLLLSVLLASLLIWRVMEASVDIRTFKRLRAGIQRQDKGSHVVLLVLVVFGVLLGLQLDFKVQVFAITSARIFLFWLGLLLIYAGMALRISAITVLGTFFTSTAKALGSLPHEISQILQNKPRGNGAASVVDIARVSGQVAAAHSSLGDRIANLLFIVAQVNFFVGIFNLLPLLPLDGGHVVILLFEQVRSRLYRLVGRHDPGRVDLMKVMPFTYAVVAVFIGLSLLLLYAGIANPIRIQ